ncbi:hypothetical protein WJX79_010030 [Trebouxia sp. C0005]
MTAGAGELTSDFKSLIKQKFDARTSYDKDNERHPTLAAQLVKRSNLRLGWQACFNKQKLKGPLQASTTSNSLKET